MLKLLKIYASIMNVKAKVLEINCFKDFFFLPITNQLI